MAASAVEGQRCDTAAAECSGTRTVAEAPSRLSVKVTVPTGIGPPAGTLATVAVSSTFTGVTDRSRLDDSVVVVGRSL